MVNDGWQRSLGQRSQLWLLGLAFAPLDVFHNLAFAIAVAADRRPFDKVATAPGDMLHNAFFAIVHEFNVLERSVLGLFYKT